MSKIWLIGAVTFVVALVAAGLAVELVTTRGGVHLLPLDSPEGVAQRYLLALEDEDYKEAYGYLGSELQEQCSFDYFLKGVSYTRLKDSQVTLESVRVMDDRAQVTARVTVFEPGAPFGGSEYSYDWTFHLKREEGQWRLTDTPEMPWPAWCPPAAPKGGY